MTLLGRCIYVHICRFNCPKTIEERIHRLQISSSPSSYLKMLSIFISNPSSLKKRGSPASTLVTVPEQIDLHIFKKAIFCHNLPSESREG